MRQLVARIALLGLVVPPILSNADEASSSFQSLGVPVRKAGLMGVIVGPGPTAGAERIYFNFRQDGGKLFLVAVDPDTGASEQFSSPVGTGAWGFIVGPDGRIYLGTHEGPDPRDSGQILVFDPKQPDKQIQVVGRPSETETYIWQFCIGTDGKLYGCTYPNAKLVSYDPKTGALADHGVMDDTQKYTRSVCAGPDGKIYTSVGYGKANLVVFDPLTGGRISILPEEYRSHREQTTCSVYKGVDGHVYVNATRMEVVNGDPENGEIKRPVGVTLVVRDGELIDAPNPADPESCTTLTDGRRVTNVTLDGAYDLVSPDGNVEHRRFAYKGDGAGLFMVSNGPLGRIYGGTFMPNELFWYDPETGALENPGNPSEVGGEIYSMLDHHGSMYICSYPGSFLSKWDPVQPWNYGREPDNNPRGFGPLGPGHLRPRAMIHGPDENIYIGSYPEYGFHGGSLGVWDPVQDRLIENYHHLIRNQAIVALVFDPVTGLVFGASSVHGGGGTDPVEPEAKFFAFDSKAKKLAREHVPYMGAEYIRSLTRVGRRIYGVANADNLFVYDIDQDEIVHKGELGAGSVLDCSLQPWKDGKLYGISNRNVFALDPETYAVTVLATYPRSIRCGFAIDGHGIYFGDRAELVRYNWSKTP
ncbi:MAG: hypothetical protein AMXMBFR4_05780 [Candidatus Hydrogenedentota bacterium]